MNFTYTSFDIVAYGTMVYVAGAGSSPPPPPPSPPAGDGHIAGVAQRPPEMTNNVASRPPVVVRT